MWRSPPAWGRGSKQHIDAANAGDIQVAPRVGAWIETARTGTRRAHGPGQPDARLLRRAKKGTVRVVRDKQLLAVPFVTLNVELDGERGLLGIALHPAFATNHLIYVYLTVPGSPPHNRVTRFTIS